MITRYGCVTGMMITRDGQRCQIRRGVRNFPHFSADSFLRMNILWTLFWRTLSWGHRLSAGFFIDECLQITDCPRNKATDCPLAFLLMSVSKLRTVREIFMNKSHRLSADFLLVIRAHKLSVDSLDCFTAADKTYSIKIVCENEKARTVCLNQLNAYT